MTRAAAISRLAEYALNGADVRDHVHIYDAVAAAAAQEVTDGDGEHLKQLAETAAKLAAELRRCDAKQLQFRALLKPRSAR